MRTFWLSAVAVESRQGRQRIVSPLADALDAADWQGRLRSQGAPRNLDGSLSRSVKLFILDGDDPSAILAGIPGVIAVPDFTSRTGKDDPLLADPLLKETAARNVSLEKAAWDNREDLAADIAKSLHPSWRSFEAGKASPSGTFTDAFTGAGTGINAVELSAWEPTGGTAWTRIFGTGDSGRYMTAENAGCFQRSGSGGSAYICDDQGSADHYTQARMVNFGNTTDDAGTVCVRLVDEDNWIGWRQRGTGSAGQRVVESVAGVQDDTQLRVQGVQDNYYRLEANGTSIELFESSDGSAWSSMGSFTSSSHQTETSQGLVSYYAQSSVWIDDFEAGALGGAGATEGTADQTVPAIEQSGSGLAETIGTSAQTLPMLRQSSTATLTVPGTAAQVVPALEQAGEGDHTASTEGTAAQTLPPLEQAADGTLTITGSSEQVIPALEQAADATLTLSGTGAQVTPALEQAASASSVEGHEGAAAQTLPAMQQAGDGTQTVTVAGEGAQTIAALTQAGAAEQIIAGTAAQVMAAMQQAGAGLETITATGVQVLAALTQAAVATLEPDATGAQVLPALEQQGEADLPTFGTGTQTVPALLQAGLGLSAGLPGLGTVIDPILISRTPQRTLNSRTLVRTVHER